MMIKHDNDYDNFNLKENHFATLCFWKHVNALIWGFNHCHHLNETLSSILYAAVCRLMQITQVPTSSDAAS